MSQILDRGWIISLGKQSLKEGENDLERVQI